MFNKINSMNSIQMKMSRIKRHKQQTFEIIYHVYYHCLKSRNGHDCTKLPIIKKILQFKTIDALHCNVQLWN